MPNHRSRRTFRSPAQFPRPTASVSPAPPLTENGWSFSLTAGRKFTAGNALDAALGMDDYPSAATDDQGRVLLAWTSKGHAHLAVDVSGAGTAKPAAPASESLALTSTAAAPTLMQM